MWISAHRPCSDVLTLYACAPRLVCVCVCVWFYAVISTCQFLLPSHHSEDRPSVSPQASPSRCSLRVTPCALANCESVQLCNSVLSRMLYKCNHRTWPFNTAFFGNTPPSCSGTRGLNRSPRGHRRTVPSPETSHIHIWKRVLNFPCQPVGSISLRKRGTVV